MPKITDLQTTKKASKASMKPKGAAKKATVIGEDQKTKKVSLKRRPGRKPKSVEEIKLSAVAEAKEAIEEVNEMDEARRQGEFVEFAGKVDSLGPETIYEEEPHAQLGEVYSEQKKKEEEEQLKAEQSASSKDEEADDELMEQAPEISFPGSELLRERFPTPFAIAEKTKQEWVKDGDFTDLPIEQPIVRELLATGLRTAKGVDKKLNTSAWINAGAERVQMARNMVGWIFRGGKK